MELTLRWQHFECQPLHMWTFLNAIALYSVIVEQDRQREEGVAIEEGELFPSSGKPNDIQSAWLSREFI